MSSASVRAALTTFMRGAVGSVAGLNRVDPAPPYWADGSEWNLANNFGSGALGAIHLVEIADDRITLPALTGSKGVSYTVGFMVFYQYLLKSNSLTPVDESDWVNPLDTILDGVKDHLRSDPTAGCGQNGPIWQCGQSKRGIREQRGLPRLLPGKVLSWNVVEFDLTEIITD